MPQLLFEPLKHFPQCHASCLLPLPDGRMLCAYFAGERERADDVAVWLSEHDGTAWLAPRKIAKICDQAHWNPVLFPVKDGVRLVFKVGREIRSWRSWTMLSRDGGRTWSPPRAYPENPAGGPVRSRPIRLRSGVLLAPNSDEDGPWTPRVDLSFDEGESFPVTARIPINQTDPASPDYLPGKGAIQPTLWESAPNQVHALLRTGAGRVYRSDSADGGRTWSRARPIDVPSNNSGIDVAQAEDGRLFLALNPVAADRGARTPLCIWESCDGGECFRPYAVVNDAPVNEFTGGGAEFSYPSLTVQGGTLHLSYTYQRRSVAYWRQEIR